MVDETDQLAGQFSSDVLEVPPVALTIPESSSSGVITEGPDISSPSIGQQVVTAISQSVSPPQPSRAPTTIDLDKVQKAVSGNACKNINEIVTKTGLEKSIVVACLNYLVSIGMLSKSAGDYYCGAEAVRTLQDQLVAFKAYKSRSSGVPPSEPTVSLSSKGVV